jgi:hypothetical protein
LKYGFLERRLNKFNDQVLEGNEGSAPKLNHQGWNIPAHLRVGPMIGAMVSPGISRRSLLGLGAGAVAAVHVTACTDLTTSSQAKSINMGPSFCME